MDFFGEEAKIVHAERECDETTHVEIRGNT